MNMGGAIRAIISFLIFVVLHYTLRPLLGWRAPMDFLVLALLLAAVRVRPSTAAVIGFVLGQISDSLAPDALGAGALAMGAAGQARVRERFTWTAIAERTEAAYQAARLA